MMEKIYNTIRIFAAMAALMALMLMSSCATIVNVSSVQADVDEGRSAEHKVEWKAQIKGHKLYVEGELQNAPWSQTDSTIRIDKPEIKFTLKTN